MRGETAKKGITTRGSVEYIEIERKNVAFENILNKLKTYQYEDISKVNQEILKEFLEDMSKGKYTPVKARKGQRSYKRLCKLFYCLKTFTGFYTGTNILKIKEEDLHKIFDDLNSDKILRKNGKPYKDKRDFKKDFSTLWHWHMVKSYKVHNKNIKDIIEFITTNKESRPNFCYFTFKELSEDIVTLTRKDELRTVLMVLFDSGLRPSEFYNIKRKDIIEKEGKLQIRVREEISKTFERTITLGLTSQIFRKYLENNKHERDDFIFIKYKYGLDQFFIRIRDNKTIKKIMRNSDTNKISAYDFRHSSACHYINVYSENTTSRMKYRYGWKKESMIEYYTNFLGVSDIITEEDLLDVKDKNKYLEENKELKNNMKQLQEQMKIMAQTVQSLMKGKDIKDIASEENNLRLIYEHGE